MAIRRGEVYAYSLPTLRERASRSPYRLVMTADHLNVEPERMLMVGVQVRDSDPGGLLAVRLGELGWASVLHIERLLPASLGALLYTATPDELDEVAAAMRAAYDL